MFPVAALADRLIVVRVVPISLPSCASTARDGCGQPATVRLVLALGDRRVARPLGAHRLVRLLLHLQLVDGVALPLLDLLEGEFARTQRIAPGELGRGGVVGDRLHFQDVQAAKFGDLLEGQRRVLDKPAGRRMGHERLSHLQSP